MSNNVLVIRSASTQQLSYNLDAIKTKFMNCKLILLTHAHNFQGNKYFKEFNRISLFESREAFNKKDLPKELIKEKFQAVVILCSNLTGKGYGNILDMVSILNFEKLYFLNKLSEYIEIKDLSGNRLKDNLIKIFAIFCTFIPAFIFLFFLPLFLFVTLLNKFKE